MATHDYVIANGTGAAVRSDLNNALAAIVSNNSSSSEPGTTYAYQWWADTNANVLKIRNSANNAWITLRELDGTMLIEDGSASTPGLAFADDTNTGVYSPAADKIGFATSGGERLVMGGSEAVFNDPGNNVDFRVESNSNTHMLFVDAGNDRVGINTTAPSAPLHINAGSTNDALFVNSTDANVSLGLAGSDGSVRLFEISAGLAFRTGGSANAFASSGDSEKMRLDSSGNLGLGTSSPTSYANSQATLVIEDDTNPAICWSDTGQTRDWWAVANGSNLSFNYADGGGSGSASNITNALSMDNSGNVGVGTTSNYDDSPLEVRKTAGGDGVAIRVTNNTTTSGSQAGIIFTTTTSDFTSAAIAHKRNDNALIFYNGQSSGGGGFANATERLRVDSSGRLLVGTSTAPSVGSFASTAKLVSQGNTTESIGGAVLSLQRGEAATAITSGEYLGNICFTDSAGSEFARIDGVADDDAGSGDYPGRLVFLTTANSASSPTEKYIIESDGEQRMFSTNTSYTLVLNNGTSAGTSYLLLEGRHSATSNTGQTGTRSLSITTNGNIFNTNNSYGQISDVKLKENIVNASSQWDDIKGVQVRNFNFKEETGHPTHTQIGVVAQELETVSPGLVYDTPDVDADRNDLGTVTKTVNYSVLYMKAVKALQEAMDRIETLETKVAALEAG